MLTNLFHHYPVVTGLSILLLLTALLAGSVLLGSWTSRRLNRAVGGLGAIESSVFAVFGLLVAFSFTGATERFTTRRTMVLDEAKTAMTAWDQAGLLPEPQRVALRERLKAYLDLKLGVFERLEGVEDLERRLAAAELAGRDLLGAVVEVCRSEAGRDFAELLVPPFNQLREIALARKTAIRHHPPAAVYLFLVGLALVCGFFAGFSLLPVGLERWLHVAGFSVVIGLAIYLTLDLEFPRMGMLRVDAADQILRDVRRAMP